MISSPLLVGRRACSLQSPTSRIQWGTKTRPSWTCPDQRVSWRWWWPRDRTCGGTWGSRGSGPCWRGMTRPGTDSSRRERCWCSQGGWGRGPGEDLPLPPRRKQWSVWGLKMINIELGRSSWWSHLSSPTPVLSPTVVSSVRRRPDTQTEHRGQHWAGYSDGGTYWAAATRTTAARRLTDPGSCRWECRLK